jgi:hypothetical protein
VGPTEAEVLSSPDIISPDPPVYPKWVRQHHFFGMLKGFYREEGPIGRHWIKYRKWVHSLQAFSEPLQNLLLPCAPQDGARTAETITPTVQPDPASPWQGFPRIRSQDGVSLDPGMTDNPSRGWGLAWGGMGL